MFREKGTRFAEKRRNPRNCCGGEGGRNTHLICKISKKKEKESSIEGVHRKNSDEGKRFCFWGGRPRQKNPPIPRRRGVGGKKVGRGKSYQGGSLWRGGGRGRAGIWRRKGLSLIARKEGICKPQIETSKKKKHTTLSRRKKRGNYELQQIPKKHNQKGKTHNAKLGLGGFFFGVFSQGKTA